MGQERIVQFGSGEWVHQWRRGRTYDWMHITSADSLEELEAQIEKRRLEREGEEFAKSIIQTINLPPSRPTLTWKVGYWLARSFKK